MGGAIQIDGVAVGRVGRGQGQFHRRRIEANDEVRRATDEPAQGTAAPGVVDDAVARLESVDVAEADRVGGVADRAGGEARCGLVRLGE